MMVGLAKPRPTLQSQNNGDPVMTNRREFLKLSSLVGLGATVPTFLARTAFAAPDAAKPGALGRAAEALRGPPLDDGGPRKASAHPTEPE